MEPSNSASQSPVAAPPNPPSTTTSASAKPKRWQPKSPASTPFNWGDLLGKLVAPALTAAGLVIGVWQYQDQQATNDALEFKRAVWNKRLAAYEELSMVAAQLVTSFPQAISATNLPPVEPAALSAKQGTTKFDSLSQRFYVLYWGKLPLVDDAKVSAALKQFNDELKSVEFGESSEVILKQKGYFLVETCQNSLRESWHEDLAHPLAAHDTTRVK